jgi:hypothetical protein
MAQAHATHSDAATMSAALICLSFFHFPFKRGSYRGQMLSVFEALPTKQGGHRAALAHQSPRHPAAHKLHRGSLLESLLDGHLHHILNRLDRVAPAARAIARDRLQQATAFATTCSGLTEFNL